MKFINRFIGRLAFFLMFATFCSGASAALGEGPWGFSMGEKDIKNFSKYGEGAEYGCESFSPERVSFILTYDKPDSRLSVKTDDQHNVLHNPVAKTYTIKNARKVVFSLPGKNKYMIENTTGTAVTGKDCDAGVY